MSVIDVLKKKAENLNKRIIFPEGEDERIIRAAEISRKSRTAKPILVGNESEIKTKAKQLGINPDNLEIIQPSKSKKLETYATFYSKLSKIPKRTAMSIAQQPIFFSALALKTRDADGMIGGLVYTSGDFIAVCKGVIGLRKGIKVPSSFFLMEIPSYEGGEDGVLLYSDCSVNPNPTPEELADIALSTGRTAEMLLGWKPRIAMLSFSTKGSASHPDVCKVIKATEIAKRKGKGMAVDGELQADAALVLSTAQKKIKPKIGPVAGRANILIFPDLDAGNTAYKLTQVLARANAYGPILQGFKKPLSDLSRGCKVEDIVGATAIVCILAERWKE